MNCFHCKVEIFDPSTHSSDSLSCGIQLSNDKWYCRGCSDVIDFIEDVSPVITRPIPAVPPSPPSTIAQPVKTAPIACQTSFFCRTCKLQVRGSKCMTCGMLSPLTGRRKK